MKAIEGDLSDCLTEGKRVGISVHVLGDIRHRLAHLKRRHATAVLNDLCDSSINN